MEDQTVGADMGPTNVRPETWSMVDRYCRPHALLTLPEISDEIGVPLATLRWWRSQGRGPKTALIGKRVMARREDVAKWLDNAFENAVGS